MQTIRLPKHLPTSRELAHMNERLHAGEIRLDWHDVTAATSEQLESLFKGLSLPDDYDTLGITTIPDELQAIIAATFDKLEQQAIQKTHTSPPPSKRRVLVKPEIWLPEGGIYADNEEINKTVFRIFPESEEQVVFPATPTAQPEPAPMPAPPPDDTAALEKTISRPAIGTKKASSNSTMPATPTRPESTKQVKQDTPKKILAPLSPAALRDKLETMVITDLLGPAGGLDEEIEDDHVRDRYLVGLIAPKETAIPPEELDNNGISEDGSEETGVPDVDASQTSSLSPSSIGMSFCVDLNASSIQITTRWGHYQRASSEFLMKDKGQPKRVWKRTQRGGTPKLLALHEGAIDPWEPEPDEQPNVFVRGLIRRSENYWTVTLFLVNAQSMPKQNRDSACLFQPELIVEDPNGGSIFRRRPTSSQLMYRQADKPLAMLYRKHASFAIGHGVSVHAETLAADPTCAIRLSTEIIPRYEVPRTEAPSVGEIPALADLCLDMRQLAAATPDELQPMLMPLIDAYSSWIDTQTSRINDPAAELASFEETAHQAIQNCREAQQRIRAGIKLLGTDPVAAQAFAFMNRAMWLQRIHTSVAEEKRQQGTRKLSDFDQLANRSWRPFQLAFILLNLPALTDLNHSERNTTPEAIADLLWFPTGGGKTEAYLGLTAYTLAIRRLQGEVTGRSGESGIAVIMRYTLRLLTLQQFQRAAALICACEAIRRPASATWGETPFRLGLWVGQHSTPDTTNQSDEAVKGFHETNSRYYAGSGNPAQLTHCPWCGSKIDPGKNIFVETYEKGRGRTFIYCGDSEGQCQFTRAKSKDEGLPVLVVDEEIYRLLPALLITTVDKFAQLPWRGQTQMLFGQVDSYCERHGFRSSEIKDRDSHTALGSLDNVHSIPHGPLRPPDLIIQDELHLISGPLGTMVGLYETAIDTLSTWEVHGQPVRPKVIAATATIRQADQQIQALFQRQTRIFPPQGLDIEDNFFSRQRRPDAQNPGRRYLGICANGRRMKAAQIRVYLAHLAAAQKLSNDYGPGAADPWLTLVGYFNSMSELGGMRHLVDDDISNRIWRMDQRGLASKSSSLHVKELTSRVSSTEIPATLNNLEQSFGVPDVNGTEGLKPIDILLATNMISVGVDVKRLSLMVVVGQPRTTAEYIQATSRIGRNYPGLVCTVYNWARPRDLSHYEQFEHYHATFYQQVEALSVTPFAPRALDRGLAALLTSLIRLSGSTFNRNNAAGKVTAEMTEFLQAIDAISQRAEKVTGTPEARQSVQEDLQKLIDYWTQRASSYPGLGYEEERDDKTVKLLKRPGRGKWEPFTALNSLRNVEPGIQLLLDSRGLGGNLFLNDRINIQEEVGEES